MLIPGMLVELTHLLGQACSFSTWSQLGRFLYFALIICPKYCPDYAIAKSTPFNSVSMIYLVRLLYWMTICYIYTDLLAYLLLNTSHILRRQESGGMLQTNPVLRIFCHYLISQIFLPDLAAGTCMFPNNHSVP